MNGGVNRCAFMMLPWYPSIARDDFIHLLIPRIIEALHK
jgi:hypothetical protein